MIQHIAYVALQLPEPENAIAYYEQVLGLEPGGAGTLSARPHQAVHLTARELVISQGGPAFDRVAFAVDSFDGLPAGRMAEDELRVEGPDGLTFAFLRPEPGRPRRSGPAPLELTRLGHITFWSPEPLAAANWCCERLGFRVSERLSEEFIWLRCNRDHHTVAFAHGPRVGVHHVAFEVPGWLEMLRLCDHLREMGQPVEFGPGRHGPGNNLFIYFLDPWGVRFEIFCDLRRIDHEEGYVAPVHQIDPGKSANRWGPRPPASFAGQALPALRHSPSTRG